MADSDETNDDAIETSAEIADAGAPRQASTPAAPGPDAITFDW